jgi:hypothetical protein
MVLSMEVLHRFDMSLWIHSCHFDERERERERCKLMMVRYHFVFFENKNRSSCETAALVAAQLLY